MLENRSKKVNSLQQATLLEQILVLVVEGIVLDRGECIIGGMCEIFVVVVIIVVFFIIVFFVQLVQFVNEVAVKEVVKELTLCFVEHGLLLWLVICFVVLLVCCCCC